MTTTNEISRTRSAVAVGDPTEGFDTSAEVQLPAIRDFLWTDGFDVDALPMSPVVGFYDINKYDDRYWWLDDKGCVRSAKCEHPESYRGLSIRNVLPSTAAHLMTGAAGLAGGWWTDENCGPGHLHRTVAEHLGMGSFVAFLALGLTSIFMLESRGLFGMRRALKARRFARLVRERGAAHSAGTRYPLLLMRARRTAKVLARYADNATLVSETALSAMRLKNRLEDVQADIQATEALLAVVEGEGDEYLLESVQLRLTELATLQARLAAGIDQRIRAVYAAADFAQKLSSMEESGIISNTLVDPLDVRAAAALPVPLATVRILNKVALVSADGVDTL